MGSRSGLEHKPSTLLPGLGPHATLVVDPGNIRNRKLAFEYDSCPFDGGGGATFHHLSSRADTPGKSAIDFFYTCRWEAGGVFLGSMAEYRGRTCSRQVGSSIVPCFARLILADSSSLMEVSMEVRAANKEGSND